MWSVIIILIILFIFLLVCYRFINKTIETLVDNQLSIEPFDNFNSDVREDCQCKKKDILTNNILNFQTPASIPGCLSDYTYYVNDTYIDKKIDTPPKKNECCMYKPKLLYDGIYEPYIFENKGFEKIRWKLTNGNINDGYYCSNKLMQKNKEMPINCNDCEPQNDNSDYYCKVADDDDLVCLSNKLGK
jgi:hypothetical protein